MVSAGEVKVHITGDMRDLDVALRQAQAATSRATDRMGGDFAALGRRVAQVGTIIGAAIAAGVGLAVREAAGAEEIRSKFDAVFRDSADGVREWAQTTADAVSRSSIAFEQYLSTFQDTFVPLGFARAEAAQFSQTLTQLAVDLASFNNESEPETVRALQSALVGNHETVRRYGVIINQAALEAELLNMGIRGGTDAATAQQMALARLNIIMAGTTDAQGDAARTADSATNQYRSFTAQVRDAAVAIGDSFMPAAQELLAWAESLIPLLERVGTGIGNVFSALATNPFDGMNESELRAAIARYERILSESHLDRGSRSAASGMLADANQALFDLLQSEAVAEAQARAAGRQAMTDARRQSNAAAGAAGNGTAEATESLDEFLATLQPAIRAEVEHNRELEQYGRLAENFAEKTQLRNEAVRQSKLAMDEASQAFSRFTIDSERAALSVTEAIGGAFDNMARGISVTFNDLASEIMQIMARIAFNNLIARPIANFTQGLFDGALGNVLGTSSGQALTSSVGKSAAQTVAQTVINVDARYATEGTAEMIAQAFQKNGPALVQSSVSASVEAFSEISGSRSAV